MPVPRKGITKGPKGPPRKIIRAGPKRTVYVNNLNDKINEEELKASLYSCFSQFGGIIDVTYRKNQKTRGQAWIVFQNVADAANAVRQMNGFVFYDKPIKISFAIVDCDAVPKMLGTYKPGMDRKASKIGNTSIDSQEESTSFTAQSKPTSVVTDNDANKILLLLNLPEDTDEKKLQIIFGQLPGLKEVRLIQNRHDVAFVEYGTEAEATSAKNSLSGYMIDSKHAMKIVYAKSN